jgi:hypothetical protein
MNEDPTRLMDYGDEPPRRRRPPQQPKGNLRLVVLVMGVVIFGLLIGLIASCGGGETKTVTQTRTITEEVPAKTTGENGTGEGEEEGEEGAEESEEGTEEGAESQEAQEIQEAEEAEAQELQEIEEAEAAETGEIEAAPEEGIVGEEGGFGTE